MQVPHVVPLSLPRLHTHTLPGVARVSPSELRGGSQPHPPQGGAEGGSCSPAVGSGWKRGAAWGLGWESGLSCMRAPGRLPTSGAGRPGWAGGSLPVLLSPLPHCPLCSEGDWDAGNDASAHLPHLLPPLFPAPPPPSLCLCLSDSLCLRSWVPGPGAGPCKCGISHLISGAAGLICRRGASAEPLIKAGRQLGECQGGLGPRRRPRPGAGAVRGEGAGGWLPLSPPAGPNHTICGLWPLLCGQRPGLPPTL